MALDKSHHDICIVGAGIAGLSAAQSLHDKKLTVTVLEKSRGPGGRMATRRIDAAQFNHGAPSFTLTSPAFIAWANAHNDCLQIAENRASSGHYKATSSAHSTMNLVARSVFTPTNFHTLIRVSGLAQIQQNIWQVTYQHETPTGEVLETGTLTTNKLVLALPAPQAAALLKPLPAPFTAIAALAESAAYEPCWVAMFTLANQSCIPVNDFNEVELANGAPFSKCVRQAPQAGSTNESWVIHATPEWTTTHLNHTKEQAVDALYSAFSKHYNCTETPVQLAAHRWLYSQPSAEIKQTDAALESHALGLFCIGDWLPSMPTTNAVSNVERAWISGQQLRDFF